MRSDWSGALPAALLSVCSHACRLAATSSNRRLAASTGVSCGGHCQLMYFSPAHCYNPPPTTLAHCATALPVQASLAAGIVDAVLIPEVPFSLEGEHGLLAYLQRIMEEKGGLYLTMASAALDWFGCSAWPLLAYLHHGGEGWVVVEGQVLR